MNPIISRFCPRTEFDSYEDFYENYRCIVPPDFNFAFDVADRWAEIDPDKLALKWTDDSGVIETFTFGSLKASSGQAANALLRLGIQKGDTVMLILKQRPAVWTLLLALEKIGAVAIPASYQLTQKDIAYRCTAAGVKLLVVVDEPGIVETALAARPGCPPGMALAVCGAASRSEAFGFPPGCIDILAEIAAASPDFPRPAGGRTEDPMLIYFSSGTTGMPKMVLHNHSLPLGHIVTAKYWQCVEEGGVHLTQTDSGWAKFAWGKIYGQWICGAAVAVYDTEKFTPDGMLDALDRLRPATFCAPATIFRFLIKEDLSGRDFSYISHTSVAGEPLSPEVYHKIRSMMGLEIREGFGQSEGSVLLANFRWFPVRPGAMGKPAPLFGIALLGEDGAPCDDGIVGTISVTNAGEPATLTTPPPSPAGSSLPGLFTGYWKDDGITAACWHDGTYRTGDMAWRDGDGYYWFVGRNDDVIKCSGYRIGPFEVESALMEHPSVLECAVTAAPDPMRGQVVKATVVLARGFAPSAGLVRELQNHVKRVTAPYKYPRIVEFAAELPKTSSGKIQRNIIRERDAGSN